MIGQRRFLFRIILPAFPPFNIYGRIAKTTTSLGPVYVGTVANKLPNWDVEIIDENNCASRFCPKDKNGLPDHAALQKERPADVVGFYGSMTSAVPRLFQLAKFYKEQGATTITGGYHVKNLPRETLENNIDIVCMGEGEITIKNILQALENKSMLGTVAGISFLQNDELVTTESQELIENLDALPMADFGLVRYAKLKTYPVGRTRGCNMCCEFCAVKDKSRCCSPEKMVAQIAHLVETRGARRFFDVSDHFVASGIQDSIKFCELLTEYQQRMGVRIQMTVQIRLSDARHLELLQAMKDAGIYNLAIGIESCIDEELRAMKKGYQEKDIYAWLDTYHRYGFFIHAMMIFGYPEKPENRIAITIRERRKRFKKLIKHVDTVQVLLPVPLPGTELTERLRRDGRLYDIPYEYFDGQFLLFEPDEKVDPEELQKSATTIMGGFYRFIYILHLIKAILLHFPLIVFPRVLTLTTLRVRYIVQGFRLWHKEYFRNNAIRFGGSYIVRNWKRYFRESGFMEELRKRKLQK